MRKIDTIVIHHTASDRDTTTRTMIDIWHKKQGWSGIGYHYVIEGDGQVVKGREERLIGAHVKGMNSSSIGVVLTGNFEKQLPSEAQVASLKALILDLKTRYPDAVVTWHRALAATLCPGKNLVAILTGWRTVGII